jgi:hypothetical protein
VTKNTEGLFVVGLRHEGETRGREGAARAWVMRVSSMCGAVLPVN